VPNSIILLGEPDGVGPANRPSYPINRGMIVL